MAASGELVRAINKSEMATVEGKPAIIPPTSGPKRSAAVVAKATKLPPIRKLRVNWRRKVWSTNKGSIAVGRGLGNGMGKSSEMRALRSAEVPASA